MNVTELIGKRVLIHEGRGYGQDDHVKEYKLLEIAPSGNWVKMMNDNGLKFWRPIVKISIVEVLKKLKNINEKT